MTFIYPPESPRGLLARFHEALLRRQEDLRPDGPLQVPFSSRDYVMLTSVLRRAICEVLPCLTCGKAYQEFQGSHSHYLYDCPARVRVNIYCQRCKSYSTFEFRADLAP